MQSFSRVQSVGSVGGDIIEVDVDPELSYLKATRNY